MVMLTVPFTYIPDGCASKRMRVEEEEWINKKKERRETKPKSIDKEFQYLEAHAYVNRYSFRVMI